MAVKPLEESIPRDETELTSTDSFKDETDQTAAEYFVVPVLGHPSISRSSSEARSTPSSVEPMSGPSTVVLPYLTESQTISRSTSEHSQLTPIGQPRLENVNEAYLLRHFQRHLADWVRSLLSIACFKSMAKPLHSSMPGIPSAISRPMSPDARPSLHFYCMPV